MPRSTRCVVRSCVPCGHLEPRPGLCGVMVWGATTAQDDAHAGHLVLSYHRWCSSFIRRPEKANEIKLKTDGSSASRSSAWSRQRSRRSVLSTSARRSRSRCRSASRSRRGSLLASQGPQARDDAMQNVLAEAASKLPSLVSGCYPALSKALILEVRAYNTRAAC